MQLVAVSVVKNEADIIEAFVRHTGAWVNRHLVFDHDSTDGTREILAALQAEGRPLNLFTDDALGNLQEARSNELVRQAAARWGADWVLPLDADEIFVGPGRAALEQALAATGGDAPVSLPMLNYYSTREDNPETINPALRLMYCDAAPGPTRKVIIPRPLALDAAVAAGKGSHALQRDGQPLGSRPLPDDYWLAHLAVRSPGQQAMRVVLAELQKLSRGRRHAGLDVHYRLGFQLLTENPEAFFGIIRPPSAGLRRLPVDYRGGPLHQTTVLSDWNRVARALLPYLEKLAISHGALFDTVHADDASPNDAGPALMRELAPSTRPPDLAIGSPDAFTGFDPVSGWGAQEGPLPAPFLPVFHWGLAPSTQLRISSDRAREGSFRAEALTYSDDQVVIVELNGAVLQRFSFERTNQKQVLAARLPLCAGENFLTLHYERSLQTSYDPRKLAVIFLSLRVAS